MIDVVEQRSARIRIIPVVTIEDAKTRPLGSRLAGNLPVLKSFPPQPLLPFAI